MSAPLDNSIIARSIFSNDVKREVLWNVLEPGDPYDIRNSMIAKLPGDKKIFMGSHLELICLLQTAEIERLSEFLDNYRLKLRDIERGQLDRHSYEIQIKQLLQKLDEEQSYKSQNSKLKEFINKQGSQIQILRQNTRDNRGFDEKSLERINQLMHQNIDLKQSNDRYKLEALTFNARVEALEQARIKQIEDLRLNYARYSKESHESNLSAYRMQSEGQLRQLEFELKRLKEQNDSKTVQINKKHCENEIMQKRLIELTGKGGNYNLIERQIVQYQNQIRVFTTENDKLIISLRDYTNRLSQSEFIKNQVEKKLHQYEILLRQNESKLRQKDNELIIMKENLKKNQQPPMQIGQSQQQLLKYESRINILTRQNLQLNQKLRYQVSIQNQLREEISALTFDKSKFGLVYQENIDLKNANFQRNSLQMRSAELENRNILLSQQIQRLTKLLTNRESQLFQSKTICFENQALKTKIREIQYGFKIKYETDLTRLKAQYEQKINYSNKLTGNQLQSRIQIYQGQMQGLKQQLKTKNITEDKYKARIYELQSQLNRSSFQNMAKLKHLQANLVSISKQNQNLSARTRQLQQIQNKLIQSQNRSAQIERQCQRLSQLVRARQEEIYRLKNILNEVEGKTQHNEYDLSRQVTVYETNMKNSRIQNQELRRKINEIVNDANKKFNQSLKEMERLNQIIRKMGEQRNQFAQENEFAKQNLMKSFQQNDDLRRRMLQGENKSANLVNEYSNRIKIVTMDNDNLKKQLNEKISIFNNYQLQISRKTISYEQNKGGIGKENEELRKRLRQCQQRNSSSAQQMEAINQKFKIKNDQFMMLQTNYRNLGLEYENLKKYVKDYEATIKNKFEGEVSIKYSDYQQMIKHLRYENEELRKRMIDEQTSFGRLNEQLDKIRNNFKAIGQENESIKKIIAQKEILTSNIQLEANTKITNYENNIKNLTRLNEQQYKKIVENELLIRQKIDELNRLDNKHKQLQNDHEGAKRQLRALQQAANSKLQVDVVRRFSDYEFTIAQYTRRLNDSEQRQMNLNQQCLKNVSNLNAISAENETLKTKLQQFQLSISAFETEVNRRTVLYQQNINRLEQQKQIVSKRLYEAEQVNQAKHFHNNDIDIIGQENEGYKERQKLLNEQNEDIKRLLFQKESQMTSLDQKCTDLLEEIRRITSIYQQDVLQLKQQNEDLLHKWQQVEERNINQQQLENTPLSNIYSEENARIRENLIILSQQNEDLKRQLIQQNTSIKILEEMKVPTLPQSIRQDNNTKFTQFAQKMQVLTQQIQQLKQTLKIQADKNSQLQNELKRNVDTINQYEHQIQSLQNMMKGKDQNEEKYSIYSQQIEAKKRENQYLKHQMEELASVSNRSEMQLMFLNQQIVRLNEKLSIKQAEYDKLKSISQSQENQIDQIKRQYRQLQASSSKQQLQPEVTNNYSYYQITIDQLRKQNTRLSEMNQNAFNDIQKLNLKYQTLQKYNVGSDQQNQNVIKSTNESEQLLRMYNQLALKNQHIIQICEQSERKLLEADSTINYLKRQMDNLQKQIKMKTEEAESILKQFKQYQESVHYNFQIQVSKRCHSFEDQLSNLIRQNEELKKQLMLKMCEPGNQQQNQIISLKQQINRLNMAVNTKSNQNQNLETKNKHLLHEEEMLRRRLQENSNSGYQNLQYERKIDQYAKKIEELQLSLEDRTDQLNSTQFKLKQFQEKKEILKQEICRMSERSRQQDDTKPVQNYQQNSISALSLERDELLKRIAEFEKKINLMNLQYDRLNLQYKSAIEELQSLRRRSKPIEEQESREFTIPQYAYSPINTDFEAAKRHLEEYELSIRKLYNEFSRLQSIIDDLRRQKKSVGEKNRALSAEITRLNKQNKQLDEEVKNIRLRLSDEGALEKRVQEHMTLVVILFAEIQSLRKRLKQKERQDAYRSSLSPQIL